MSGHLSSLASEVTDIINCGILVVDSDHTIVMANNWLLDAARLDLALVTGETLSNVFKDSDFNLLSRAIEQAVNLGTSSILSHRLHPHLFPLFCVGKLESKSIEPKLIEPKLIEQQCQVLPLTIGERRLAVLQIFDVSATATQLRNLKQSNTLLRQFSLAVDSSPNSVVVLERDGTITYVNKKFSDITGYTSIDAIGQSYFSLCCNQEPSDIIELIKRRLTNALPWQSKRVNRNNKGELYWVQEKLLPIVDSDSRATHYVATQEDITEVHNITQKITYQASHDLLTGLINRQEFERVLAKLVDSVQDSHAEHVLCFLDLDQFKIVNDTCGHVVGDELLRQISTRILSHLDSDDTFARIGGDEFAIVLRSKSMDEANKIAQSLIQFVKKFRFRWEQHVFTVGVSIGITAITAKVASSVDIIMQADSACYAAKDAGRNRVHIYHDEDELLAQRQGDTYWVTQINEALEHDRFVLYAQPIVPLLTDEKVSFEVLVRMEQASGELIAPGFFLPPAERYNLSHRIDEWVIGNTLSWLDTHADEIDHIDHISINLSGQTLCNEVLLAHIQNILDLSVINPSKLSFEITETAAIANLGYAQYFIDTLRAYGCKFALDDFGSGLSSFAYLKNLHVDLLKIDGMFVKDILDDPIDEAMVRSINDVGHVIGMKTVAEFVENDEIKQRLIQIGVDYGQGYGLGKPEPIDNILLYCPQKV